eukprot:m.310630 g.310630  ORF g.310630 m.310630 type:complete len:489 (+) comp53304_c0_seq1:36-1502(+)
MPSYSLGQLLRLQMRVAQLLTADQVRRCLQKLESGRHTSSMESIPPAIDVLQNTRQMCANDKEYCNLLLDILPGINDRALEAVKDTLPSLISGREDGADSPPFVVGNCPYVRHTGSGNGSQPRFNSLLMRLSDHLGPTNVRIMAQTSPLEDCDIEQVNNADTLFELLASINATGPDNVQLLMDWFQELHLEGCLVEVLEYWTMDTSSSLIESSPEAPPPPPVVKQYPGIPALSAVMPRNIRYAEEVSGDLKTGIFDGSTFIPKKEPSSLYPDLSDEMTFSPERSMGGVSGDASIEGARLLPQKWIPVTTEVTGTELERKRPLEGSKDEDNSQDPAREKAKRFKDSGSESEGDGYESAKEYLETEISSVMTTKGVLTKKGEDVVAKKTNSENRCSENTENLKNGNQEQSEEMELVNNEETDEEEEKDDKEEEDKEEVEDDEEEEGEDSNEEESSDESPEDREIGNRVEERKSSVIGPFLNRISTFLGWK